MNITFVSNCHLPPPKEKYLLKPQGSLKEMQAQGKMDGRCLEGQERLDITGDDTWDLTEERGLCRVLIAPDDNGNTYTKGYMPRLNEINS